MLTLCHCIFHWRFAMKLNPKFNGRYVQGAGGAKLFVEEVGDASKPTILWIHGYCQSRLSWDRQFENEALASQFHMLRLDLRGHGLSDKLTDAAAFQESKNWADDIHAVIHDLESQEACFGRVVLRWFH